MADSDDYVLGRGDAETRRLILQHQIYAPATRRLFQAAGIGPGMSVVTVPDPDEIAGRLRDEVVAAAGVQTSALIGAWTRAA